MPNFLVLFFPISVHYYISKNLQYRRVGFIFFPEQNRGGGGGGGFYTAKA